MNTNNVKIPTIKITNMFGCYGGFRGGKYHLELIRAINEYSIKQKNQKRKILEVIKNDRS